MKRLINKIFNKNSIEEKQIIDIKKMYHQDYELSRVRRYMPWNLTDRGVEENEKVLIAFYYRKNGSIAEQEDGSEWYGLNEFIFYVIEKDNSTYIKYFNFRKLAGLFRSKAAEFAPENFTNIPYYLQEEYGIKTKEYKDFLLNDVCKIIELDKTDLMKRLQSLGNIDYSNSCIEFFEYSNSNESIDYYDTVNKKIFYSDDYCPMKYKACIDFFDYILGKCKILNMQKSNFEFFEEEDREIIMKKLVDLAIENKKYEMENFE